MTVEISVPWTPIKALANLANAEDIRPWTRGVWIDSTGPQRVLVATNGQVLGAYCTDEPSTDVPAFFLPLHIIKACKGFAVSATVKADETGHASIECMGTRHYWQDEKLVFVDWRRAFPSSCSGVAQQFDVELLARFAKVRRDLGRKPIPAGVQVAHNGRDSTDPITSAALVTLADVTDFVGVLMTLRQGQSADPLLMVRSAPPRWACPTTCSVDDLV